MQASFSYSSNFGGDVSINLSHAFEQLRVAKETQDSRSIRPQEEDGENEKGEESGEAEDMDLGIITAIAACPAIVGTNEAIKIGQAKSDKERHRSIKTHLIANCVGEGSRNTQIHGGMVVLRDGRLFIDTRLDEDLEFEQPSSHLFTGYFLPYPDYRWPMRGSGLVSTISEDPPTLNWIYINPTTHAVHYAPKTQLNTISESNDPNHSPPLVGPWNCTKVDHRMTFDEWEGFLAVREAKNCWALYFDLDDDGLRQVGIAEGKRVLEIELIRREARVGRPEDGPGVEEGGLYDEEEEEEEHVGEEEEEEGDDVDDFL